MHSSTTRLTRPLQPMPTFIRDALVGSGLMDAYRDRPPYQQNDYLGWNKRSEPRMLELP